MFFSNGLEEVIFNLHDSLPDVPDELIIVSGYLGPAPVDRLIDLPFKTTVFGGMYTKGIDLNLLNALNDSKSKNPKLNLFYSTIEVHSKIYVWKKSGKILSALIGSANFSANGLRTNLRETLAVANRGTFPDLEAYLKIVEKNSTNAPSIKEKHENTVSELNLIPTIELGEVKSMSLKISCDLPLFKQKKDGTKNIPDFSGLNWGLSNGHVSSGDAYIRIPKNIINENQGLIKAFDPTYQNTSGNKKRASDPIELIWDDGTVMEASLEGSQKGNDGLEYPKQLATFGPKKILGLYLRKRLGVTIDHKITIDDLENYGRDTVTLSLIDEGIYYCDFSTNKK